MSVWRGFTFLKMSVYINPQDFFLFLLNSTNTQLLVLQSRAHNGWAGKSGSEVCHPHLRDTLTSWIILFRASNVHISLPSSLTPPVIVVAVVVFVCCCCVLLSLFFITCCCCFDICYRDFPIRFEGPHVITNEQIWVGVVSKGSDGITLNSSYANRY